MNSIQKIAFGGGCHWCTEAVFQSLIGVKKVEQGYVASVGENASFSEAVIIHFNVSVISLEVLIKIHLLTHKSTSEHSMRDKYRSAIYTFSEEQQAVSNKIINKLQDQFKNQVITKVLPYNSFKALRKEITNYYYKNPQKPFCETYIDPKLKLLLDKFSMYVKKDQLNHLQYAEYKT